MDYIRVELMALPPSISALTIRVDCSAYVIIINAGKNYETQRKAYRHELAHIEGCDFEHYEQIDALESARHAS